MAVDYLPKNDEDFADWLELFIDMLIANQAVLPVTPAQIAALQALLAQLRTDIADAQEKEAAWHGAVQAEITTRSVVEGLVRPLAKQVQEDPDTTDAMRAVAGLTVRKKTRTRRGVGTEVPGIVLELRAGGEIIVHWGTNPNNENSNSKPVWAKGVNVYRQLAGETKKTLIAFDSSSPYLDTITGAATTVTYFVAYRGTKETDIGPMSPGQSVAAGGTVGGPVGGGPA